MTEISASTYPPPQRPVKGFIYVQRAYKVHMEEVVA